MRNIFGLEQPDSGHLCWLGETTVIPSPRAARDKGIAMVFQEFSLVEEMTVIENLYLYLGPTFDWEYDVLPVQKMLDTKIKPYSLVNELSAGEKQQIEILRSILISPSLLILDEPTSGLDPIQLVDIRNLINEVGKKRTVILSTHIMQEVEAMCERVVMIHRGQLVADDKVANLSSQPGGLEAAFQSLCTSA